MLESLEAALLGLRRAGGTRCIVLKGAGEKAFSCGMDLEMMSGMTAGESLRLLGEGGPLRRALREVESSPCPVIAAIRGYAVGVALELAIACDLRVASKSCRVGMPAARVGMVYAPEGLTRFIQTVGLPATRKLLHTASYFGAEEALSMGIVDYVVSDESLEESAVELAEALAGNAPISMRGHKRAIALLAGGTWLSGSETSELGRLGREALESADAAEGLRAFKEKREPRF